MKASEYRWAGAATLFSILAIVLANQHRVGTREVRETRQQIVTLRAAADRLQRSSVAAPVTEEAEEESAQTASGSPPVSTRVAYPDEIEFGNPEERDRARRIALSKMYAEPEARALLRAEAIEGLRSYHPGVAQKLGLSPDEEDRLMEVLAESQLNSAERSRGDDSVYASDFESYQQMLDAEILAHLGQTKLNAFKRYRESIGERREVGQFRAALPEKEDLTPDAAERLIDALAQERARMQAEQKQRPREPGKGGFGMYFRGGRGVTFDPKDGDTALTEAREQLEEQDERMQKAAESVLNPPQQKAYAEFVRERRDERIEMIESTLREQAAAARSD
jgi:hypothetical protein